MNLALVEISLHHYGDAEQHLKKAVAVDPGSIQAYNDLANFYRLQNRIVGGAAGATGWCRKESRRDPALYRLGVDTGEPRTGREMPMSSSTSCANSCQIPPMLPWPLATSISNRNRWTRRWANTAEVTRRHRRILISRSGCRTFTFRRISYSWRPTWIER